MNLTFCPQCGQQSLTFKNQQRMQCDSCGFVMYQNVAATASLVMRCGNRILMARRARNPRKDHFDFPGGFVEQNESLEKGLEREIQEELGYLPEGYRYLMSSANTYHYCNMDYYLCDAYFLLDVVSEPALRPGDDVGEVIWQDLKSINCDHIAFSSVWQVIEHLRAL